MALLSYGGWRRLGNGGRRGRIGRWDLFALLRHKFAGDATDTRPAAREERTGAGTANCA